MLAAIFHAFRNSRHSHNMTQVIDGADHRVIHITVVHSVDKTRVNFQAVYG